MDKELNNDLSKKTETPEDFVDANSIKELFAKENFFPSKALLSLLLDDDCEKALTYANNKYLENGFVVADKVTDSKAVKILRALTDVKKLKEICAQYNISYKFCQAISVGRKDPTFSFMEKFRPIIPVEYWFEEAPENYKPDIGYILN